MSAPSITLLQSNTILYCRRWQETVRFYQEKIGLEVTFENDWFIEFKAAGSFLSIANAAHATIHDVEGQGITLAWKVADLLQAQSHLLDQQIKTTPIQDRWNARVFYCHDPEGHRIEFWADAQPEAEPRR